LGGLDPAVFVEPERIAWESFDGRRISGFLYRPPARFPGRRPVLIVIHGGPESQFQPAFIGRWNYYPSEMGVALVYPNVRGSAGFGKSFLKLDDGARREDAVRDIGALLDWIAREPGLDASRVMVMRGSYGGYMTYAAMTHYQARLRCGSALFGISNFVTFLERTEAYRRDLRRAEYGDEREPQVRALLERISPLASAHRISRPMLIYGGKNDPRVPYTEGEQMAAAIRRNGGTVWYLLAQDEGHGLDRKANADYHFLAQARFAEQFLLR